MANLNKFFCIGRMTRDPESRSTPQGRAITSFGMAINRTYRDRNKEQQQEVLFMDFVTFGPLAELVAKYGNKGKEIHVEGHLQLSEWEDKNSGEKRSKIQCIADGVQFLGSPGGDNAGQSDPFGG